MTTFFTVAGNTSPARQLTLQRDDTAIDLTGATVQMIIKKENTDTVTATVSCSIVNDTSGIISYTQASAHFPSAGRYLADVKITFGGGAIEILHNQVLFVARAANS